MRKEISANQLELFSCIIEGRTVTVPPPKFTRDGAEGHEATCGPLATYRARALNEGPREGRYPYIDFVGCPEETFVVKWSMDRHP